MAPRTKAAARCTECDRALAVWQVTDEEVVPIGSVNGCPCGGTTFDLIENTL